ncbi:MAG: hypothetical protein WCA10_20005 [Terracidiphilus sp.]
MSQQKGEVHLLEPMKINAAHNSIEPVEYLAASVTPRIISIDNPHHRMMIRPNIEADIRDGDLPIEVRKPI